MSSGMPVVKQIAWLSILVQFVVLGVLITIFRFTGINEPIIFGGLTFFCLLFILRYFIPRAHRQGIAMYRKKEFAAAIPHFEESYRFFSTHEWVDNFRFITMFSSSRISYREMALVNIAFCHAQAGNRDTSKEYYYKALAEFPKSELARSALKLMED